MLILAIDTSTRAGSVAFLRDFEVLAVVSAYEETPHSSRLFRDMALLEQKANLRLDQADVFAVAAGPGSFTGLRIGLTAVKAWSEVHRKPIAAVSGLEAIASEYLDDAAVDTETLRYIAPFVDARRGQLYGAVYRFSSENEGELTLDSEESILSLDEFLVLVERRAGQGLQIVSPTPELLPSVRLSELGPGRQVVRVSAALAPAIGKLGYRMAKAGRLVDAIGLDANYVRRSDAEARWKDA
jgi:tRNA threonylcarbamoyladenosine biosynthesis protein TsaB